jgi:hypothetical protein
LAHASLSEHERPASELSGDEEDDFVQSLRRFKEQFHIPDDAKVIYPGSSTHVGTARAFGKDNVVHVDPDDRAVGVLEGHGYKAVARGISEYTPDEKSDVIVGLNSYGILSQEDVERLLNDGRYLVTNNYTNWAHEAAELENLSLVGAMLPRYEEGGVFLEGEDIPENATDIVTRYYRFPKEGGVFPAKEGDPGALPDESARYPDGLFVFRKK